MVNVHRVKSPGSPLSPWTFYRRASKALDRGTSRKTTVKIWTPEKFAVITLKFEQGGFTAEQYIQTMRTELQTV